jgi:hypothetical protein
VCNWDLSKFQQNAINIITIHQYLIDNDKHDAKNYWNMFANESKCSDRLSKVISGEEWIDFSLAQSGVIHKQLEEEVFQAQISTTKDLTKVDWLHAVEILKTGKFIVFYPDLSLTDGTAQTVSNGYFSYSNYPPFGTWLYFFAPEQLLSPNLPHILSWIPPQFSKRAIWGIEVIPNESISVISKDSEGCYVQSLIEFELLPKV